MSNQCTFDEYELLAPWDADDAEVDNFWMAASGKPAFLTGTSGMLGGTHCAVMRLMKLQCGQFFTKDLLCIHNSYNRKVYRPPVALHFSKRDKCSCHITQQDLLLITVGRWYRQTDGILREW